MKQSASSLRQPWQTKKQHKRKLELQLNMVAKLWDLSLIHKSNTWPRIAPRLNGIVRHAFTNPPPHLPSTIQQLCQTTFHCSTLAYFAYFRLPFFGCDIVTNFYATQFLWQTFPIFICIPHITRQQRVCCRHKIGLSYFLVCMCIYIFFWVSASRACTAALSSYSLFSILFFFFYYFFFSVKTCLQAQNYCDRR